MGMFATTKSIGASYTVQAGDLGTMLISTSDSPVTFTFPAGLPAGAVTFLQGGYGRIKFVAQSEYVLPAVATCSGGRGANIVATHFSTGAPNLAGHWDLTGNIFPLAPGAS